ncbi:hypothetical protein ASPZODRAFT_2129214 [Penicilliopsis zonata CBS 506.65]|uniref:Uncharacterized protein n=1 Tax=Penicilliopsis zonata CBS 506.65 TaxID=1073090 RepID=A0A1L9SJK4_9EURO|nr:hypothetical protein ASPZODRAFT_2129214 [Penicilliopsis zonata CBS 506.65]OJJ47400.1 hypothetical protein ASPZODRAFT_2129214 [Penicilliopsis zonata CBS 506.65]
MSPALESSSLEPIAVVGLGCRFSGEASSVEGFWNLLRHGRSTHGRVPSSRYEASAWYHPYHERKGAINHESGFFLEEDPAYFDAPFFSITAKEAAGMDPAQRLLLEVAYEAFENAGVPIETLPGSRTAVFSGCMTNDYELLSTSDLYDMPHNAATGNGRTMLANRLSWFFDLRGPSVMLDTACSSSLTALHLAVQALRAGECDMALVTGTSLILDPNFTQRLSYMHMLSADGISHSFDIKANGYGRGEGVGAVVLKSVRTAIANQDGIRAVIKATGINQDGRTPGITMPSRDAQAALIRSVYNTPGLPSMRETAYFEAHGTGTEIGDPTELSAIGDTLGAARQTDDEPVYVGSVKSNIGHTEGAAGVASIIKAVLCLEHAMLVPNAGFSQLNPRIHLDEWRLRLSDACIPWPAHLPLRLSINSFGFGGSNAHTVLESADGYVKQAAAPDASKAPRPLQLVVFSTQDQAGLARTTARWIQFLQRQSEPHAGLIDLAYTMARRSQLAFRSFAVADSQTSLAARLQQGLPSFPRASRTTQANVAFIFTGQGAQWARMGVELLACPVFAQSLQTSQEILTALGCPWKLLDELQASAGKSALNQPDRSQPLCCALQVALVDLLASWGTRPKAVVGHSSGESAAAYAAGFISQADTMKIAYCRGVCSRQVAEQGARGAMLAVGISPEDAQRALRQQGVPSQAVVVACVNSPSSVTLSGDADQIQRIEKHFQAENRFARRLRVDVAYHSPHMQALASECARLLESVQPMAKATASPVTMFSSVTKERVAPHELTASYWVRNMVQPVEFTAAVSQMARMTVTAKGSRRRVSPVKWGVWVEIGPNDTLRGPVAQILQGLDTPNLGALPYLAPVRRGTDALTTALQAAGSLWSLGARIDIHAVNESLVRVQPRLAVDLPAYCWNHTSRFWHEPLESTRRRQRREPRHDLLGAAWEPQCTSEPRWRNFLRIAELPWLADHVVAGSILFPAAGMVAMVAEAARQMADASSLAFSGIEFNDLAFKRALVVTPDERGVETVLQVCLHPSLAGWYEFRLFSLPSSSESVLHATGAFTHHRDASGIPIQDAAWEETVRRMRGVQPVAAAIDIHAVYSWLSETGGVTLGPAFRSLTGALFSSSMEDASLCTEAVVPDTQRTMPHEYESPCFIHPTALDALFQTAVLSASEALGNANSRIPVAVDRLYLSTEWLLHAGDPFAVYTESRGGRRDVIAARPDWVHPGVILQGIQLGNVAARKKKNNKIDVASTSKLCSSLEWIEHLESPTSPASAADWARRLCYTHGDARAMVITNQASMSITSLRSLMPQSRRPCLHELLVLHVGVEATDTNELGIPGVRSRHTHKMSEIPLVLKDTKSFNLILVEQAAFWQGVEHDKDLVYLRSVISNDGSLAIRAPSDAAAREAVISRMQQSSDWNTTGLTQDEGYIVLFPRPPTPASLGSTPVFLLTAGSPIGQFQTSIEQVFSSQGMNVRSITTQEIDALNDSIVISWLDMDSSWIPAWTADELAHLQALLRRARCVLSVSPIPPCGEASSDTQTVSGISTGLLRTLRNEYPHLSLPHVQIDLDDSPDELARGLSRVLQRTLSPSGHKDTRVCDYEYRLTQGQILVPRLLALDQVDDVLQGILYGPQPTPGRLVSDSRPLQEITDEEGSRWVENELPSLASDIIEVQIHLQTSGISSSGPEGRVSAAEAVGTIIQLGDEVGTDLAVGDVVILLLIPASAAVKLPPGLTPAQVVGVGIAYTMAYMSLIHSAVHQPLLLVGQWGSQTLRALVNVAVAIGYPQTKIHIAGISDPKEERARAELRQLYPDIHLLPLDGGLDARLAQLTASRGVGRVVSCLADPWARSAARCLAVGGTYINLGGEMHPNSLPGTFWTQGRTLSTPDLDLILRHQPEEACALFRAAILLFGSSQPDTLRPAMIVPVASRNHVSKTDDRIVLDLMGPGQVSIVPRPPPAITLNPHHTFVLAGGLGTLGVALAHTLHECGARHLVFLSRSGHVSETLQPGVEALKQNGGRVDIVCCDITRREAVEQFVAAAREQKWLIKGVLQCATVLRDTMFKDMTFNQWTESTACKIQGTLNLHRALADAGLAFFIALSSVASVIGNMGQGNYSAGNSFMDTLMTWRRTCGLSGHSINIGLVVDGSGQGEAEVTLEERRRRYRFLQGTEILTREVQGLIKVILQQHQSPSSLPAQIIAGIHDDLPRDTDDAPAWQRDRKFGHRIVQSHDDGDSTVSPDSISPAGRLKQATSLEDAGMYVEQAFKEYLAKAMMATPDVIDPELPLSALGVDSLKVTEVQQWVSHTLGSDLSSFEFLASQPLKQLAEKIASTSTLVNTSKY